MPGLFARGLQALEAFYVRNAVVPDVSRKKRTTLAANPTPDGAPTFNHSEWDALLREYVSPDQQINAVAGVNVVDYAAIAQDGRFASYLKALAEADVESLPVAERFALWMNAYNALCISLIIERSRARGALVNSINDISEGKAKVWDLRAGVVGGVAVSLNDVEHVQLRGAFDEPMVHACIVCASASCPNLRAEAFAASRLREQMDGQFAAFMANTTKGLAYEAGQLSLSRILLWFAADFGGARQAAEAAIAALPASHALRQAGAAVSSQAASKQRAYFEYDWSINGKPSPDGAATTIP